ncbi:hypothetical protein [Neoroseomonas lacus]|uniref:Lectin n=1 Tax=Neoroseomonas lacus TaxID=287609 RepID=A0A917KYK5_9PROT|nr:hypothetical protein [Neoroseomonas lacus]GGJ33433.1 hypothetical protein GCM10011320_46380 [Neoroseomonas lacus]
MVRITSLAAALAAMASVCPAAQAQAPQPGQMTFFVTSIGSGRGGDLGGLAGADAHCQSLALAAGVGPRNWRAYLSTSAAPGTPAVNARDRIGTGPWRNAQGVVIARSVAELHSDNNNLTKQTALTERGAVVNGRGDTPNTHDVLTGSQDDGTGFTGTEDRTCRNWTYGGAEGGAMLGHHDRMGLPNDPRAASWNASHVSRGCTQDGLRSTGGAGLFYCFAVD